MHEYDIALKHVLRTSTALVSALTGSPIRQWLNVDLGEVLDRCVDLLGEAEDGRLIHIELQSTNDAAMIWRMAEYALAIRRRYGSIPYQVVLYVGSEPLRMKSGTDETRFPYECRMVDIREFDGELLLESPRLGDALLAILARLRDSREAVRRILEAIAACGQPERKKALAELMILAGLRRLGAIIKEEALRMPILDDIMDHEVLGHEYKNGQRDVVSRQVEKRFGAMPEWARERLASMSHGETEAAALRLLDARSLDEVFPK